MITKIGLASVLLLNVLAISSGAEVLYTMVSPNEQTYGRFGVSVCGGLDANDDGYDDIVVGTTDEMSPFCAGRAYVFSWMSLSAGLSGDALELQWSPWPTASQYWIYGADNLAYFEPGLGPSYEHRLVMLLPWTTSWSTANGIGDPDHNWTYVVISVDGSENELARSNRAGEHDFEGDIP